MEKWISDMKERREDCFIDPSLFGTFQIKNMEAILDSAYKSNQAGNVKIVYCEGAGLAANNQAQLEGIIGGAKISTNEGLAYIKV